MLAQDLDQFRRWLERTCEYRPRSVQKICCDVRTLLVHGGVPHSTRAARIRDYQWVCRLWSDYAEDTGAPPLPIAAPEAPPAPRNRRRALEQRTLPAESIDPAQWDRLLDVLRQGATPAELVVLVLASTGLRVSDVLRARPEDIRVALSREDGIVRLEVKGGKTIYASTAAAPEAWARLEHVCRGRATVADAIVRDSPPEAGSPAYERVRMALVVAGRQAGVTGRLHLHRLRRTVAVLLLDEGYSLETVQAAFGHSDIRTTQRYTDEQRAKAAGAALAGLRKRRPG